MQFDSNGNLLVKLSALTVATVNGLTVEAGSTSSNVISLSFSNTNGVSFGLNGNTITASVSAATVSSATISAGTQSQTLSNLVFSNSNGLSFGLNNGTITASYTVPSGANINISAGSTSNNLSAVTFNNANGISFGLDGSTLTASHNGITTAAQSNQVVNSLNGSTGQISLVIGSSLSSSVNNSTITFGLASDITTALQSTGPYLTTAMASNRGTDFVQATAAFNGTNASGTIASNAISVSVNPQTAQTQSNVQGISAGTQVGRTGDIVFSNSNNISFGMSNSSVVTASFSQSVQTQGQVSINGSTGNISLNVGSSLSSSVNGNSITFGLASNITTALQSTGNYLTTARASNDGVGLNTNQTNVTWTVNSSGISFDASGYAGTGTTLALTNLTGTLSQDSNGVALALSAAAGGGGGLTLSYFNPQDAYIQVGNQQGQATLHIQPMQAPNVTYDRIMIPYLFTGASNSTASITLSNWVGIFTRNDSTLSLLTSFSSSTAFTHSGTASSSVYNGIRLFSISNAGELLTEGQYWVGHISRTTTGGANATFSHMAASQQNSNFSGLFGVGTNATYQYTRGLGHYSASTTAMPASLAFSEIRGTASVVLRQPLFYLVSGTV